MRHLTPDELVDIMEAGDTPSAFRSHLEICESCRAHRDALLAILADARMVALPEPSPLFWNRLSDRVRLEIEADPVEARRSWSWLRWPVLVPLTGLAAIVLALASVITPRTVTIDSTVTSRVTSVESQVVDENDIAAVEETWALVSDLVSPLEIEAARDAGFDTKLGAADGAILYLTVDEERELVRLLREELGQPGG
jgi:hypothetical protein